MVTRVSGFMAQKMGSTSDECEDAWEAPEHPTGTRDFRCAIADGASESSFAKIWARLLVQAYAGGNLCAGSPGAGLTPVRAQWASQVGGSRLPWYAEEKAHRGAYAALLGLHLTDVAEGIGGTWTGCAVGDCCLFLVRRNELHTCFPMDSSAEFSRRPTLISTHIDDTSVVPTVRSGIWHDDDMFLLMTDALAKWFLSCTERGDKPWRMLQDVEGDLFAMFISALRDDGTLQNDDVTLVRVVVAAGL